MPTKDEALVAVYRAAFEAVSIFHEHGLPCCIMGSGAAYLWNRAKARDNIRTPDDLDLVVMTTREDSEELKRLLVSCGTDFTLENAWNPKKTYKIVFYHTPLLPEPLKIDLLVPGDLNIPLLPYEAFVHLNILKALPAADYTLPCMPLLPLIILKLQAWNNLRNDKQRKDLSGLLRIAPYHSVHVAFGAKLPEAFMQLLTDLAPNFVEVVPESKNQWRKIGLML
ncbi:hypothetical protein PsYK624_029370 [Phanerochaete sordida]|uniref:Nucleotidyltransferase family protein n=1 Tax=Phanerochaete sordida TaxID=48140 RepID=A0A9P3G3B0_9APHY|nr:hypothetical protein PsYK624_029370 [Phanerochaete sordida]